MHGIQKAAVCATRIGTAQKRSRERGKRGAAPLI